MTDEPDGTKPKSGGSDGADRPMTSAEFLARKRAAQAEAEGAIAQAPVRRRAPKSRPQLPGPAAPAPVDPPPTVAVEPFGAPPAQQYLRGEPPPGASVYEQPQAVQSYQNPQPVPPYVPFDTPPEPRGRWVRLPRRSGFMRRFVISAAILGVIVWIASGRISNYIDGQLHPVTECGILGMVHVDDGDTSAIIRAKLSDAGIGLTAAATSDLNAGVSTPLDGALPGFYVMPTGVGDEVFTTFQQGPIDGDVPPEVSCVDAVPFRIEQGMTTNDVVSELSSEGLIGNPTVFRYWLRNRPSEVFNVDDGFQAGNYTLAKDLDSSDVLRILLAGPEELAGPVLQITVPEGLTIAEVKSVLLDNAEGFDTNEFDEALLSDSLLWEHFPDLPFRLMEGMLFPARYDIYEGGEGDELGFLQQMADKFRDVTRGLSIEERSAALGVTPYEAVVIASLIEEEAKVDGDRAKIARVIYNRLEAGMALQIDATTRFAVNKAPGEPLLQSDLDDPSPWNTRAPGSQGLPPTPIAIVGEASLEAALNPAEGSWIFYVLTDEGGEIGAHTFATTDEEFATAKAICTDLGYCG